MASLPVTATPGDDAPSNSPLVDMQPPQQAEEEEAEGGVFVDGAGLQSVANALSHLIGKRRRRPPATAAAVVSGAAPPKRKRRAVLDAWSGDKVAAQSTTTSSGSCRADCTGGGGVSVLGGKDDCCGGGGGSSSNHGAVAACEEEEHHREEEDEEREEEESATSPPDRSEQEAWRATLLSRCKDVLAAMDEKVCGQVLTHLTDSFGLVFRYVHETIMGTRPNRTIDHDGYLHQMKIHNCTFIPPSSNGDSLPPRVAEQRILTYCSEIMIQNAYTVYREVIADGSDDSSSSSSSSWTYAGKTWEAVPCHHDISEPIHVGTIPQMVETLGCLLSSGEVLPDMDPHKNFPGFFIVSGTPKVMSPIERLLNNTPLLFEDASSSYPYFLEFRSSHHSKPHRSTSTFLMKMARFHAKQPSSSHGVMVELPYVDGHFPLMVLFMALGWHQEDVVSAIQLAAGDQFHSEFLPVMETMLYNTEGCKTQRDALLYISERAKRPEPQAEKRIAWVLNILHNELLPHMGYHPGVNTEKGMALGDFWWRLIMFSKGYIAPSDRDDTNLKRFDNAAIMLASLIRQLWRLTTKKSERTFAEQIEKDRPIDVTHLFNGRNITPRVISCMSTGNWSAKKGANKVRSNVTQPLIQMNEMAKLAHLMRVASVHTSDCTNEKRRQIARNSYKRICPSETPEGATCGLVKHLALGAHISTGSCPMALMRVLFAFHDFVPLHEWKQVASGTAKTRRGTRQWVERHRSAATSNSAAAAASGGGGGRKRTLSQSQSTSDLEEFAATSTCKASSPIDGGNKKRRRVAANETSVPSTTDPLTSVRARRRSLPSLSVHEVGKSSSSSSVHCGAKRRRSSDEDGDEDGDVEEEEAEDDDDDSSSSDEEEKEEEEGGTERPKWVKVFVNGIWFGWILRVSAAEFVASVRSMRRKLQVSQNTSVCPMPDMSEIRINCESGKVMRPLALPDAIFRPPSTMPPSPMITLHCLQVAGLIEYVDAAEEETLRIAHTAEEFLSAPPGTFTHCEISPDHLFGVSVGCIPYAPNNQCCRCTYQAAMGKQAQQVWATRPRGEATTFTMDYGQKPLVYTHTAKQLGMDKVMSGINVRVCIACYTGFNIEDSIIMNQALVDRGAFISSETKRFKDEQKKHGSSSNCEQFEKPRPETTRCMRNADYSALDRDGLIPSSTSVGERSMIIGKRAPNHSISKSADAHVPESMEANSETAKLRDVSVGLRKGDAGTVVQTMVTYGRNPNLRSVTVLVRLRRIPVMGDKFACYTPDHQILTENGWANVADVQIGDLAATFDPDSQSICYEPVEAVHAYPVVNEPLYEVNTQQFSLKTTLNHNMYVKKRRSTQFELLPAQDVHRKRVRFLKNSPNGLASNQCREPPCPVPTPDANAFLFLFGFWIGKGSKRHRRHQRVTICQVKAASKRRIIQAAKSCGLRPVCNGDKIHFYHKPLFNLLAPLSTGAPNKALPPWCFQLSKAHSFRLLEGLMDSDGTINKSGAWSYSTSSMQLKDDVQRLALHAGLSANVSIHHPAGTKSCIEGREVVSTYDQWQVRINRYKNQPELNHGHARTQNGQSETICQWTGSVHCVTVRTGILYVRRGGKSVWCGNSRHAQKGTVGCMMADEDMPFNRHGSVSIIVNPHCLPSRKTVGHLVEALVSVAGCYSSDVPLEVRSIGNDMPLTIELAKRILRAFGLAPSGKEQFQNGRTGEMISGHLFSGLIYYQRLKHMVDDKKHARGLRGPTQILTRQPREGRIRLGGLRFGYMEGDVLYAHGASQMHQERLTTFSDEFTCYVCHICGFIGEYNAGQNMYYCRHCDKNDTLWEVQLPYSFKLMIQEMMGNGCVMRLKLQKSDGDPTIWCPEAKATHPQLFRFRGTVVEEVQDETAAAGAQMMPPPDAPRPPSHNNRKRQLDDSPADYSVSSFTAHPTIGSANSAAAVNEEPSSKRTRY